MRLTQALGEGQSPYRKVVPDNNVCDTGGTAAAARRQLDKALDKQRT